MQISVKKRKEFLGLKHASPALGMWGNLVGVARAGKLHRGQYGESTPLRQRGVGGVMPPAYPLQWLTVPY